MPASQAVYPMVVRWIEVVVGPGQAWAVAAMARLVRASMSDTAVPARQGYTRVARAVARPRLTPGFLTPRLVRAALAMDSVRLGGWEVFTVGVVWHGRVLIVGGRVLPYPWPKGAFTPTVCALLSEVAAAWPTDRAAPALLADRGFPSNRLVTTLAGLGWQFTIRLRATDVGVVAGVYQTVREAIARATPGRFTAMAATYGTGRQATAGTLVVGRGLAVLAWHQRDDGSARHRTKRAARRDHHGATKRGRGIRRQAPATDRGLVLFTTHPTWRPAVSSYRRRWATEGSYRDAQTGWDGWSGWDLGGAITRLRDGEAVARGVGLWALGLLLQSWVGDQAGQATAPTIQAALGSWTTTGRLSVWARGRLVFLDPSTRLLPWLLDTLQAGADRLAAAQPLSATIVPFAPRPRSPLQRAA